MLASHSDCAEVVAILFREANDYILFFDDR